MTMYIISWKKYDLMTVSYTPPYLSYMMLSKIGDIMYDVILKHMWHHIRYRKNNFNLPFLCFCLWFPPMISFFCMILPMISELPDIIPVIAYDTALCQYYPISMPYDVTDFMISQQMAWHLRSLWHGICAARVGGARLQPAPSRRSTGSGLAILVANVLGTGVQLRMANGWPWFCARTCYSGWCRGECWFAADW